MNALRPRNLVFAVIALLLLFMVVLGRLSPPSPLPVDADPSRFSAMRAASILDDLLGDGTPHPVGSVANERVRERIVEHLVSLGYSPEIQREFNCGKYATCATVANIIAKLPGETPGPAIALVAHYDSVPAGPGAGDDGSGVASLLEIARILKAEAAPQYPTLFIFTDGEEAGLLGATAFVQRHPLAKDIGAVVNVEARGTRGPSLLFETVNRDAWLIDRYASFAKRPVVSSLFSSVYEKMPNDSDLSVFGERGIPGVNFAFLGGVEHYHTPLDDIANLRLDSLQHHGENALAMVRGLAASKLDAPRSGKAVYFDVLSLGIIRWDASLSLPLSVTALFGTSLLLFFARRQDIAVGESLLSFGAFFLALAVALMTSWAIANTVALLGVTRNWVAYPGPMLLGFAAVGALSMALSASLVQRATPVASLLGVSLGMSALSIAASTLLPGASYLFIVPALGAVLVGAVLIRPGACESKVFPALLASPALAGGAVCFPVIALLYDAVGLAAMPVFTASVSLVLALLLPFASALPLAHFRKLNWSLCLVGLAALITGAILPLSSAKLPERLSLALFHDADSGVSTWLAQPESGRLPKEMRDAGAFSARMSGMAPGVRGLAFTAAANPDSEVRPPEFRMMDRRAGASHLREARLHISVEESSTLSLAFPWEAPIEAVSVGGQNVIPRREGAYRIVNVFGADDEGVDVSVKIRGKEPVEMKAISSTPGLGVAGKRLIQSRPKTAVPSQDGDMTLASRDIEL